jgi:hypothetical protein
VIATSGRVDAGAVVVGGAVTGAAVVGGAVDAAGVVTGGAVVGSTIGARVVWTEVTGGNVRGATVSPAAAEVTAEPVPDVASEPQAPRARVSAQAASRLVRRRMVVWQLVMTFSSVRRHVKSPSFEVQTRE